jgi:hypothetical protein
MSIRAVTGAFVPNHWPAEIGLTCYGVHVKIRAPDSTLIHQIIHRLPRCWELAPVAGAERSYSIEREDSQRDCDFSGRLLPAVVSTHRSFNASHVERFPRNRNRLRRSTVRRRLYSVSISRLDNKGSQGYSGPIDLPGHYEKEQLLDVVESDLNFYIATTAKRHLFVHAGVIAWKGSAVLLPGESFSGKTTLVECFLSRGAAYLSDEYAALSVEGNVHPFPRKLSIRRPDGRSRSRVAVPEDRTVRGGLLVKLLVFTAFRKEKQWDPRVISPGEALLSLLANTIPARTRPRFALSVLSRIATEAPGLKGWRGEAEAVVDSVLEWLEK